MIPLPPVTSAPGLGLPEPHLHRDWDSPCHIYTMEAIDGERNGRLPEWTPTQLTGKLHRTVIANDAPGANFNINQQGSSVVVADGLARNAIRPSGGGVGISVASSTAGLIWWCGRGGTFVRPVHGSERDPMMAAINLFECLGLLVLRRQPHTVR